MNSHIHVTTATKCLEFWWSRNLLANRSVGENIKKARGCFFHYGSLGSFQGDINPLSTQSVIDTCVMPVLLYRCENWILTERSLHKHKLESFLGWMAKSGLSTFPPLPHYSVIGDGVYEIQNPHRSITWEVGGFSSQPLPGKIRAF